MADTEGGGGPVKVRPRAAVWREVDGETVLLDLRTSTYLGINPAGSKLWPAMVEGTSVPALVELLQQRYELSREQAESDVSQFLQVCRDRGLLETG